MAKVETNLTIQLFHQCSSLISIKLSSNNYLLWKSQILPLIRTMGIEKHLTDDKPPEEHIADGKGEQLVNPRFNTWKNNDGLLTSWLLGTITEDVLSMIESSDTAYQVWKSLEEQLLSMTKENELHLNEALVSLKKGNSTLEDYLKKFKALCDMLAAMKKPLDETTKVFHLARGLGNNYKDFRVAMLSKAPYPTYNQFVQSLKNHEAQLVFTTEEKVSSQINHNQAFYTQRGRSRGR